MAYEDALADVNAIHDALARLAREVVRALADKKFQPSEVFMIGMSGMAFASRMANIVQSGNHDEILHVLEHGDWVLAG